MRRGNRRLLLAALALAGLLAAAPAASAACALSGDGSAAHPYLVTSKSTLEMVGVGDCALTANYLQTKDITWTGATPFTPIADVAGGMIRFQGAYDGGGHAIIGLRISADADRSAMFANVDDATIEHLELRDAVVDADGVFAGILIAYASADTGSIRIEDVHVTGASSITSTAGDAGAIAGYVADFGDGDPGTADYLITIADVSSTADVSANYLVGGIAGDVQLTAAGSKIVRASSTGDVSAAVDHAGGLVGRFAPGADGVLIADSYATGDVTADVYAGGLLGGWTSPMFTPPSDTVLRTYATGRVSTPGDIDGGLFGTTDSVSLSSFYDKQTTGKDDASDNAKTTAQMQDIATYRDAGWGIAAQWATPSDAMAWGICAEANGGYPFLLTAYDAPGPCAREAIGIKVVRTYGARGGLGHAPAPRAAPASVIAVRWRAPSDVPAGTTYALVWRVGSGAARTKAVGTRTSATIRVPNGADVLLTVTSSHGNESNELALPAAALGHPDYAPCRGPWQALCAGIATKHALGRITQLATFKRSGTRGLTVVCRGSVRPRARLTRAVCRLSNVGKALLRRGPIVVRMTTTLIVGPIRFVDASLVAIPRIADS